MNNPAFIITKAGIVVVDPGSSRYTGAMVVKAAAKISKLPIVAIFNTHIHGDHWLGNQGIQDAFPAVKIYAHALTIEKIAQGEGLRWVENLSKLTNKATDGTEVVAATLAIKDGDDVLIGDTNFRIYHKGQAHTMTDVLIEVVQEKLVFLGDNGVTHRIVRMDDASFKGNIAILQDAIDLAADIYVPGHGPTGDVTLVEMHQTYLKIVFDEVTKLYEEGLSDFEMRDKIHPLLMAYHGWAGYEEELGKHISLAYLEAENDAF